MNTKTIAENRVVRHEYFIIESYEAGIELFGTEVKSIRNGGVNLKDSWISIENGEAFIRNMHISPYEKGNIFNKDPYRTRKLLMHKKEILRAATRLFRCPCISRTPASRCRSGSARARSSTTSATIWQSATQAARSNAL